MDRDYENKLTNTEKIPRGEVEKSILKVYKKQDEDLEEKK